MEQESFATVDHQTTLARTLATVDMSRPKNVKNRLSSVWGIAPEKSSLQYPYFMETPEFIYT